MSGWRSGWRSKEPVTVHPPLMHSAPAASSTIGTSLPPLRASPQGFLQTKGCKTSRVVLTSRVPRTVFSFFLKKFSSSVIFPSNFALVFQTPPDVPPCPHPRCPTPPDKDHLIPLFVGPTQQDTGSKYIHIPR